MWLLSQQPELPFNFQMAAASLRPTVILCVICASSFSFLLGYDIGIMSGAKRLIKREFGLTEGELELLVGILNIVSGPGGFISGRLAAICLAAASTWRRSTSRRLLQRRCVAS